jgi:tetratricopeptide (TPR) repeat protein
MLFAAGTTACKSKTDQIKETIEAAQQFVLDGNYEEAIAAFNKAIEIDPKQPDAYSGLVTLYLDNGDYASAREVALRGIEATEADIDNSTVTYRDSADSLQGIDLLIHKLRVVEKIMTNPSRIITKEGDRTYQADYEYEFDASGRITYLKVTTEDGVEETRYTYNSAGIVETLDREGIRDYKLEKDVSHYVASYYTDNDNGSVYTRITYDQYGKQTKREITVTDTEGNVQSESVNTYSYDESGKLRASNSQEGEFIGTTSYEKDYPKMIDHGRKVMTADGQVFDWEEYKNSFDQYDRIEQIDITCHNSDTMESFLWQTTNYYYMDTLED